VDLYIHSRIRLNGVVLNWLSTGTSYFFKLMLQNGESFAILRTLNLSIVNNTTCATQLGDSIASAQICAVGSQENNACFVSIKTTCYSLSKTWLMLVCHALNRQSHGRKKLPVQQDAKYGDFRSKRYVDKIIYQFPNNYVNYLRLCLMITYA
jgi:hypothetical protein